MHMPRNGHRGINTAEDDMESNQERQERMASEKASRRLKDAANLLPEKLSLEPVDASEPLYRNWKRRWNTYLTQSGIEDAEDAKKLGVLINHVGFSVYGQIAEKDTYGSAISALDALYIAPRNELFLRHQAMSTKQEKSDVKQFSLAIQEKLRRCTWAARTAQEAQEDLGKLILIEGLYSGTIRQRLLEEVAEQTFQQLVAKAVLLEQAHQQALRYEGSRASAVAAKATEESQPASPIKNGVVEDGLATAKPRSRGHPLGPKKCFSCGQVHRKDENCRVRGNKLICFNCGRPGHIVKECTRPRRNYSSAVFAEHSETGAMHPRDSLGVARKLGDPGHCLEESAVYVTVNGHPLVALLDTGASMCYISSDSAKRLRLRSQPTNHTVSLADGSTARAEGRAVATRWSRRAQKDTGSNL